MLKYIILALGESPDGINRSHNWLKAVMNLAGMEDLAMAWLVPAQFIS